MTNGNPTICGFIPFGQLDKNSRMKKKQSERQQVTAPTQKWRFSG